MPDHDVEMHPMRAHSGGVTVRMDWGGGFCDTVGWHVIPEKNDLVECGDTLYKVQTRRFDSDEPNVIVLILEAL